MLEINKDSNTFSETIIKNLGALVDNFDDAIVGMNLEGIITGYNKGAEKLYGYSKDEMLGNTASILFPEKNEIYDLINKVKNGVYIKHWETLRKKKDGTLVLVSISISNICDNEGKIIGAVCISRSIEERQQLINKLNESEEKWRFAIEGGDFGVWDWNIRTNIVYFSNRWKEMLGYDQSDIGNSFKEWKNRIHKDDVNYVKDCTDKHFNGEEYVAEYRLKCKDGNYKWIRTRGKVIQRDRDGKPLRMIGTNEDINEDMILRKKIEESENRLRGIYNSSDSGIGLGEIILDSNNNPINYKVLHMNSCMERIIGVKFESICYENTLNILPKNGINWLNIFEQASIKGKSFTFEDYNKVMDKYFYVNIYSPNPMQFALSVTDTTEKKKKEIELIQKYEELQAVYEELAATEEELRENYQKLEKAHEEVERANKAKSQFLANMSHELRTPLNGIMGCTQMLKITKLDDDQKEDLLMIESSANHLLVLINDILDLSKIEAGKVELKYGKFNFMEQMEYVIKNLSLLAQKKSLEIMYYIDPFIHKELIGDSLRLSQVLNNLISNAIKFTDHGHILFKVKQISKNLEETKIQFLVEDTGIGIEDNFKSNIFNKFTQAEATYTKNCGGAGLGLAISKELVKMMDGELSFESEFGKGSTFNFTAVFKNVNNEESIIDTKKYFYSDNEIIHCKNILVVEDNEINMKIAAAFLKQLNYKYACVRNGQEAIDYLQENKIDIILMDIQMPVLNGYDATKIIRDREKETGEHKIIIAMTAYAMAGDRGKLIECGMDDYISKPFNIETLSEILNKTS